MLSRRLLFAISCLSCLSWSLSAVAQKKVDGDPLPGTERLTMEGDIAAQMVAGIDKFLLREIELSVERREKFWKRDFSSPEAYNKSIEPNRQRLKKILGVVDERIASQGPHVGYSLTEDSLLGSGDHRFIITPISWSCVRDITAQGLFLDGANDDKPFSESSAPFVVAIPDADLTPEQISGLVAGVPPEIQYARRLAENGCRVLVPALTNREMSKRAPPGQPGRANLTNREFVYRPAFELGRHILGYELQKVLAGIDWLKSRSTIAAVKVGVIGFGEGGLLALYAGAIDTRIDATCVIGSFGPREGVWNEPIDRNVFGSLEQFGDAEVAAMIWPRKLAVETATIQNLSLPSEGGAPATLTSITDEASQKEFKRLNGLLGRIAGQTDDRPTHATLDAVNGKVSANTLRSFLLSLKGSDTELAEAAKIKSWLRDHDKARQMRGDQQRHELIRDTQQLLAESPYVRQQFMKKLYDTKTVEQYEKVVEEYREFFAKDVIGRFEYPLEAPKPRSRKSYETEKWTGYEVMLDVFPDVFAYGILCLPKDLKAGEKRPVVVCQHGLEGRPQDVIGEQRQEIYSAFAGKLAERGFITFAPQNIYIGKDNFRTLQRKANPLGKTLFSIMVPQHQQICNWLKSLPYVDGERIAFYGLSYGGKSAMRIPPLVKDYCLSICSADFNDWVDKCASTRAPYSYVWTGEYEIFEWDLGSTFNYAEMAALIAPRPFMVERGHFDGVGVDERVAAEYAKVQRIYNVQLKMPDRCQIEYFVGPHKINGVGTFEFLQKHLRWPKPQGSE
jgi:dienelactone hydrolase